jgi:hypothetical protein
MPTKYALAFFSVIFFLTLIKKNSSLSLTSLEKKIDNIY